MRYVTFLFTKAGHFEKRRYFVFHFFKHKKPDTLRYVIFHGVFAIGRGGGGVKQKTMHFALNVYQQKIMHSLLSFYIQKGKHFVSQLYIFKNLLCIMFLYKKIIVSYILIPNYKRT